MRSLKTILLIKEKRAPLQFSEFVKVADFIVPVPDQQNCIMLKWVSVTPRL